MFLHCTKLSEKSETAAFMSLPSKSAEKPFSVSQSCRRILSKSHLSHKRYSNSINADRRKESVLSPKTKKQCLRTSFLSPLSGSLTVEAAIELPLFFILIAIILQYAVVCRTAAQFSGLMTTTAQEMALVAYKDEYGDTNQLVRGALSDAWAASSVIGKAPDRDAVQNASFLGSSYMKENDLISLVLSYRPKPKFALISLPFTFFVQKAVIRGWTGAEGSAGKGSAAGEDPAHQKVYVTDSGTVYHTDPECSHLKVTVIPAAKEDLKKARNLSGHKYRKCPHCGSSGNGGQYYIDPHGECWHTSLACPSLKRSVNTVSLDECGHLRECADCRKKRGG